MPQRYSGIVYLIPGNPGLSEFYDTFLGELKRRAPNFVYVCGNHLGMKIAGVGVKEYPGGSIRVYTLEEQVNHHSSEITSLWEQYKDNSEQRVIVMGHSMGCWLAQRVVPRIISYVPVIKALLLTPTIQNIRQSPNGKWIAPILTQKIFSMAKLAASISYWMPVWMLERLTELRLPENVDENGYRAVQNMALRPLIIHQMTEMAGEEMLKILDSRFKPFWKLADHGNLEVRLYLASKDRWVGEENEEFLLNEFTARENIKIEVSTKFSHSFCLTESKQMAERLEEEFVFPKRQ